MKKKLLVASFLALAGTGAIAQSAFQGFYGQLATGYENNSLSSLSSNAVATPTNPAFPAESITVGTANQSASGMPLVAGLGYNFALSDKWLLGVGADYSFVSQKTGNYSSTITGGNGGTFNGQQTEISNRFNVFVTPGYALDKDKLAYLKAGYSSQQLKYTAAANTPDPALSQTSTVGGYVLGVGYKQVISGGFYGFGEANYMQYSKANNNINWTATDNTYRVNLNNSAASSAYTLLFGVGYKF